MKTIVKWILSTFIGVIVSFVLVLVNENWHQLITCCMVAYVISAILYYAISEKSELRKLLTVTIFILAFILYFIIYSSMDDSDFSFLSFMIYFAPYILTTYILLGISGKNSNEV